MVSFPSEGEQLYFLPDFCITCCTSDLHSSSSSSLLNFRERSISSNKHNTQTSWFTVLGGPMCTFGVHHLSSGERNQPGLPKEPDEDDTGLGFPWRMCLALEEDGAMLSAMLIPSRCVPIKMCVGGFPHLCFFCIISALCFWGSLGLFTGVFLPLVELCHSGRRAGVSVGRMSTHCAVPRGKKVSVREMMEMCAWTDI